MTYLFRTVTTMKQHNKNKWYIDSDIIKDIEINAGSLNEALKKYADIVQDKFYINISKSAIKNRAGMYCDTANGTIQTGYVITGSTDFENNYKWIKQYINLWIEVLNISYPAELTA